MMDEMPHECPDCGAEAIAWDGAGEMTFTSYACGNSATDVMGHIHLSDECDEKPSAPLTNISVGPGSYISIDGGPEMFQPRTPVAPILKEPVAIDMPMTEFTASWILTGEGAKSAARLFRSIARQAAIARDWQIARMRIHARRRGRKK